MVARKANNIDKLQEALKKNQITFPKAKRISSVIENKNAEHWIGLAKTLSQRMLERAVAKVNPRSQVEEGTQFIAEDTLEMRAAIGIETEKLVKRAQDILSQQETRPVSLDETLKAMGLLFLEKNDPVEKAERAIKKQMRKSLALSRASKSQVHDGHEMRSESIHSSQRRVCPKRRKIPQELKHKVIFREQGPCRAENPDGKPCLDSRWTDMHHVIPLANGGTDSIENLLTLCRYDHGDRIHLVCWPRQVNLRARSLH